MKTKEIAFTLPVMIVLCEVMFFSGNVRMRLFYLTPFILTMLIIPSTLLVALGPSLTGSGGIDELTKVAGMPDVSRWDYLNTQFRVIVTYIRLLFLPINQNLDYDYPIYRTFFTLPVFLSFLFLLSVFGGGIYLVYRSFRDEGEKTHWYRLIGFGIFWFFITLSVESSVIPIADVIFEHRLYLPSVGFFLAVMAGVMWMRNRTGNKPFVQKAILAFLVLVVAGLSATAYARNMVWQSEVALWEDTVKKSPMKTRPNYNLGLLYSKQGRNDEAINLYQTAIRITPYYYRPYNDLGNAYFNKGRLDDALKEYQTALTLNPDYPESHNNMGIIFAKKKHFGEAIREFDTAIKLKPNYADAHVNLGNVYYEQGLKSEAIKHYQNALKIKPDHITARSNLEKLQGGGF
jgi:tetratricopeptide (TPR) repeat protein